MLTLGIDTSNYATSLAVVDTNSEEVVCELKQFLPVKQGMLGLRQSEALFHHVQALPQLMSKLFSTCDAGEILAVGVSYRPRPVENSYMPCFSAGVGAAAAFSLAIKKPLIKTSHQQCHIAAALFANKNNLLYNNQFMFFHVSGGTTELLLCCGTSVIEKIGQSNDLYAGQAVDRIGAKLNMAFPSGAQLSALAEGCAEAIKPRVCVDECNCSLSGLENQCNALLQDKSSEYVAKYCLSYIGHTILQILKNAKEKHGDIPVLCAGGVMCSEIIREIVHNYYKNVVFVPAKFSSDNAIGTAVIAAREANLC